ncbi:MAG: DMT family transporter [Treponema sp.]|nr:DMT family transporter [Treponema sp.]
MRYNVENHRTFAASAGLILAAAIWGFAFVIVKDSLDYIGAVWMVALRFTVAAVLLSAVFAPRFRMMSLSYLAHGAVLGLLIFLAYFFQTIGCAYTTAGKNAFLTTTYVVLVPLISWPLYRRRPAWFVFLAAVLCLAGIGLLSLGGGDGILKVNKGDVLTLICGIFYGIHIICISHYTRNEDPVLLTVLQFCFTALAGWIVAPFMEGGFPAEAVSNVRVLLSLLYLGIFSTMIAYLLQNVGLKYVPSALGSLFMSLESVFGVLFSTLFLHEPLTLRMAAGFAMIFAAIMLAEVVPNLRGTE